MHLNSFWTLCVCVIPVCVLSQADDIFDSDDSADDFIDSITGAMDTLFDYIGDENGCVYKCSNGAKPVRKPGHKPSANGCGAFGIKLDMTHVPAIERCCNRHDVCYDTCNRPKDTCDDAFKDCLTAVCKDIGKHVSRDLYEGCQSTAEMMYAATMALGCKPYKDSQKDACLCPGSHTEL